MGSGTTSEPHLVFEVTFDERTAWEAEQKGWFGAASVEFPGGRRVPMSFWDPTRLAQDLATDVENGLFCVAEPAMIVVPSVKLANMVAAVRQLARNGYFERLLAIGAKSCEPNG